MGYLRHECIVVNGWDTKRVARAHEAATAIFNEARMGSLVSGLTQHTVNGGASFLIAPDGSKEGWEPSDRGEAARREFLEWLKSDEARQLGLGWALLLVGGDDGEFRVLASPNGAEPEKTAVPLLSHLASADEEILFARDSLELAYRNSLSLARGGVSPRVVRTGARSGTLFIPGKEPLHLAGNDQLTIFERLVAAAGKGSSDLQVKALMDGFDSRSPQQAFRKDTWESIRDVYISKGAKNGYWRLVLTAQPTEKAAEEDGLTNC